MHKVKDDEVSVKRKEKLEATIKNTLVQFPNESLYRLHNSDLADARKIYTSLLNKPKKR